MRQLFVLMFVSMLTLGCDEISPIIPTLGPPEVGDRKVMVEEFTGNQCVNCPDGAAELENLHALYGENLIVVSIHAGFFAEPTPGLSTLDFRTTDGDQLLSNLGEPEGYPSAVINRTQFPSESSLQLGQSKWSNYIATEIQAAPVISIGSEHTYDNVTRQLNLDINMVPQTDLVNQPLSYSVIITESNIVNYQLTSSGQIMDYVHKHVLRDVLTAAAGDPITEPTALGVAINRNVTYTLPNNFVAENCEIIIVVTNTTTKEILQAEAIHVVE